MSHLNLLLFQLLLTIAHKMHDRPPIALELRRWAPATGAPRSCVCERTREDS